MPVFNNVLAGAAGQGGAAGYKIERSLRFNPDDASHLSRTPLSAGNRKKFTVSVWAKRSSFDTHDHLLQSGNSYFRFQSSGELIYYWNGSDAVYTTAKFRDPSAWYHVVMAVDTTQASTTHRVKMWVNGVQQATTGTWMGHDSTVSINDAAVHYIGSETSSVSVSTFDGFMADFHLLDGIAISNPDGVFGEFDADTGVWNPIEFTGDYNLAATNYDSLLTVSSGGFASNEGADKAFDGSTSTRAKAASADAIITFDLSSLSLTGSFEFWATNSQSEYSLDGGTTWTSSLSSQYTTATSDISGVSNIKFKPSSGTTMKVTAFKNQGNVLISGTPGVNGFHLDFSDNSSSAALGYDAAGSNNFTVNNISAATTATPTEPGTTYRDKVIGFYLNGNPPLLLTKEPDGTNRASNIAHGAGTNTTWAVNDVLQWAFDRDAGKVWIGRNNTWYAPGTTPVNTGANPGTGTLPGLENLSSSARLYLGKAYDSSNCQLEIPSTANYTPPTGFTYWNVSSGQWVDSGTLTSAVQDDIFSLLLPSTGKIYVEAKIKGGLNVYQCIGFMNFGETFAYADSLIDSPTNYEADTGNNGGNYCTFNPISGDLSGGGVTMSNGNLEITRSGGGNRFFDTTMSFSSNKWYWEMTTGSTVSSYPRVGIWNRGGTENYSNYPGQTAAGYNRGWGAAGMAYGSGGDISSGLPSFGANDTLMFAMDLDNGKIWFGKNGTWYSTGSSTVTAAAIAANTATARFDDLLTESTGTSWTPIVHMNSGDKWIFNPGSRPFAYTPPTGFKSLCTQNFVDPLIADGSEHFAVKKYTGKGDAIAKIGGPVYSNQVTGGSSPTSMFDGSSSSWSNLTAGNTITFTPSPDIACTQLEIWLGTDTPIRVNVNGGGYGSTFTQATLGYVDITPSGGMTSLTSLLIDAPAGGTGSGAGIRGLRINGTTIIVDGQDTSTKFKPDLAWLKSRSHSRDHFLHDSVRGSTKALWSNNTNVEHDYSPSGVTSFNDDGLTIKGAYAANYINESLVAWLWNAGDLVTNSAYNQSQAWSTFGDSNAKTNENWTHVFDGNGTAAPHVVANSGSTTVWTPSTPISFTKLEIYANNDGQGDITLNGSISTTGTVPSGGGSSIGWANVTSLISNNTLTSIEVPNSYDTDPTRLGAIKVDDKYLYDPGIIPAGSLNSSVYNQSAVWSNSVTLSGGNTGSNHPMTLAFDGNLSTRTEGDSWNEYAELAISTTIAAGGVRVYAAVTSSNPLVINLYNGSNNVETVTGSNSGGQWYATSTYSGAITKIRIERTGRAFEFNAVEVNGKILVDQGVTPAVNYPSIASTVRANPTAGFSIITYTGDGNNSLIAHGLNTAPEFIIQRRRSQAQDWNVYHSANGKNKSIILNSTDASYTSTTWNNTAPTSSVFSIVAAANPSGQTHVAYCISPVAGFSAVGKYDGTGSSEGGFVYTGFRPRWVMHKRIDAGGANVGDWRIWDTARDIDNAAESILFPNGSNAEATHSAHGLDILSNGFKFRTSDSNINANGGTYLYAAFAENPFKYARAR